MFMFVLLTYFQEQALMALKLTKGRPDALLDILGKHQLQQHQESSQLNGHSQKVWLLDIFIIFNRSLYKTFSSYVFILSSKFKYNHQHWRQS